MTALRNANGVPFAVAYRPGAEVTTVSVWILVGSRHEEVPGAAHLFEHVVMQAVPAGRHLRVVDEIEACGGDANAITSRDHVVLYARVPTRDAAAALAVLADAAAATEFDENVVAAERRVVQEELRLAAADPTDIVHDVFFSTAFGDHPMGRPVGGTADGMAPVGVAELAAWARGSVRPGLVGAVVSGGLTADEVAAVLAAGPLASNAHNQERPPDEAPPVRAGRTDLTLAAETAAVALGGPAFALADPRLPATEIVMELLVGGNASVLTEEIRSRRGLSYDVSGGASGYRDTGVWRAAISTAPENLEEVVDLATELVREAVAKGWTEAEVATARRRVAGLLVLEAESSMDDAMLLGRFVFVGDARDWTLPEHLDRLAAVGADEVNDTAREMAQALVIATAGPP